MVAFNFQIQNKDTEMNSANESLFLVISDNTSAASSRKYQHKPHYNYGKSRLVKKITKKNS